MTSQAFNKNTNSVNVSPKAVTVKSPIAHKMGLTFTACKTKTL